MNGYETNRGDLRMSISGDLFRLVSDIIGTEDKTAICLAMERLPMGRLLQAERLATSNPALAREKLKRAMEVHGSFRGLPGAGHSQPAVALGCGCFA